MLWSAMAILVASVLLVYANSFRGEFVFDDIPSILDNPNIQSLWPLSEVLSPAPKVDPGSTVDTRPILSLSLAFSHLLSGSVPWGYHLINLCIHLLNAILLFWLVRGTLNLVREGDRVGVENTIWAFVTAMAWSLHPLTTNAVTYVVQRAESLGSFFVLLCLFCASKMADGKASLGWSSWGWKMLCVISCFLGMATKESAAVIPLAIVLYERSFVFKSWGALVDKRRFFYPWLFSSWILLAWLIWLGKARGGTVGFGGEIAWRDYFVVQGWAIIHYVQVSIFPFGLCFDYGEGLPVSPSTAAPWAIAVGILLFLSIWAWLKRPAAGFAAVLFFLLLAPTSTVVPIITHPVAEHRMYLPLACIISLLVMGVANIKVLAKFPLAVRVAAVVLVCGMLGFLTYQRNQLFANPELLWLDALQKNPLNWRASNNYGMSLAARGKSEDALQYYRQAVANFEKALDLKPDYWRARGNLAFAYMDLGRYQEALPLLEKLALEMPHPTYLVLNNLGLARALTGQEGALEPIYRAVALKPDYAEGYNNIGSILARNGKNKEAIPEFIKALEIKPAYAEALSNLREACQITQRGDLALGFAEKAHTADPDSLPIIIELSNCLMLSGQADQAVRLLDQELQVHPEQLRLHKTAGLILLSQHDLPGAMAHLKKVAEADSQDAGVLNNVAWILATSKDSSVRDGKTAERYARKALQLTSGNPVVEGTIAAALAEQGRYDEAVLQSQAAIQAAEQAKMPELVTELRERQERYRERAAWRE